MACSNSPVERIRHLVSRQHGITEKKMFGVWKDSLMIRIGQNAYEAALAAEKLLNLTSSQLYWLKEKYHKKSGADE